MESIGGRIKAARLALGWRQVELAKRLGWDNRELSALERNTRRNVGADRLKLLAQTLGVSADHLLGLDAPKPPKPTRRAPKRP